jgi:3-oxoacyl-[acyl-carrier-protein] synthase II
VVVTGVGIVSPLGPLPAFWDELCRGTSAVAPIDAFDPGPEPPRCAARARDFNPKDHIPRTLLRRMDRLSQMVATACRAALADAALALTAAEAEEAGIVVGTAFGNLAESEEFLRGLFAKGPALANPLTFPNLVLNAPAGYVAIDLGLRGLNLTVCRGEASGEAALAVAYDTIVSGQADVLLAGGGDEISPILFHTYKDLGVLSPAGGRPRRYATGAGGPGSRPADAPEWSSPFDRRRNGLVMGEGAAMLVLERADRAAARGAPVYAELAGYATQTVPASPQDWPAAHAGVPEETARQLRVLGWQGPVTGADTHPDRPLLASDGGNGSRATDLVVSCANSTRRLDSFEAAHLAILLGEGTSRTLVTSVKGAIGDFGAAGAFSAAAAVLALRHGAVPCLGTLHEVDPACTLRLAAPSTAAPERGFRSVLVSASPRGGACMTLYLRSA